MRNTLIALALLLTATSVDAKPRKLPHRMRDTAWMKSCITERTGPTDGVTVAEARRICRAEQPEDEVSAAKQQLAVARAASKVAKAKERSHKAIEACEQAVVDSCVAAAPADGSVNCEDADLRTAFLVCH